MRIFPGIPLVVILEPRITYASQHGTLTKAIYCTHGSSDVSAYISTRYTCKAKSDLASKDFTCHESPEAPCNCPDASAR